MPINTNKLADSLLAAAYTANKTLEPKADEFAKEANIMRQDQIEASNEYLGKEKPELEKQITEAKKAQTDLEIYKRGIDESGADPTVGQQRYMKGLEKKGSKLTDLEASQRAADALEEKRQALIENLRKRTLNNNSIIQRIQNSKYIEDLHKLNVLNAKGKVMNEGGTK